MVRYEAGDCDRQTALTMSLPCFYLALTLCSYLFLLKYIGADSGITESVRKNFTVYMTEDLNREIGLWAL